MMEQDIIELCLYVCIVIWLSLLTNQVEQHRAWHEKQDGKGRG